MRSQRPALSGPLHVIWHITLVVFGWCLFGGSWWLVLLQKSHDLSNIIWLLSGALVLLPIITLYWVMHNRGIYAARDHGSGYRSLRMRIPRTGLAARYVPTSIDCKQAGLISVHSTADEKHFLTPSDKPHPQAKAA